MYNRSTRVCIYSTILYKYICSIIIYQTFSAIENILKVKLYLAMPMPKLNMGDLTLSGASPWMTLSRQISKLKASLKIPVILAIGILFISAGPRLLPRTITIVSGTITIFFLFSVGLGLLQLVITVIGTLSRWSRVTTTTADDFRRTRDPRG